MKSKRAILEWLNSQIELCEYNADAAENMRDEYEKAKQQFKKRGTLPQLIRIELNRPKV